MDQTTQADQADTPTATSADAPAVESGNADQVDTDRQQLDAMLDQLGGHPYMPGELRDVWPAILRDVRARQRQIDDLVAEVQAQGAILRDLVAKLGG